MIVETALGDLDVLIRFAAYNYHVAVAAVVIADQVTGADLLPTWIVYSPPWKVAKRGIRAQRGPAGAVGAPVVGPAAGGAVGCGVHCPGGVGFPELRQGGLHAFFRGGGRYCWGFPPVWLGAVDVDGVGGSIIGYAEVHRLADIPELDEVVPMDVIRFELHLLAVYIEGLGGGCGGELLDGGAGGAAQGETSEDAEPHKDRFPFPVHNLIPFRFCRVCGKHNHAEGVPGSQEQSGEQCGEKL